MTARLARVPPFTLGFVLLCLLSVAVDRVDPATEDGELVLGLLLLAFAVAGLLVALVRAPGPAGTGSPRTGLLLRAGLLAASLLQLLLVLGGAALGPLVDAQFVVGLLLLAVLTVPFAVDRSPLALQLARWAVPAGLTASVLGVPLVAARVAALG